MNPLFAAHCKFSVDGIRRRIYWHPLDLLVPQVRHRKKTGYFLKSLDDGWILGLPASRCLDAFRPNLDFPAPDDCYVGLCRWETRIQICAWEFISLVIPGNLN
jgi:hypothetical protein